MGGDCNKEITDDGPRSARRKSPGRGYSCDEEIMSHGSVRKKFQGRGM